MDSGPPASVRPSRRAAFVAATVALAAVLPVAVAVAVAAPQADRIELPARLVDPSSGASVALRPGAGVLHVVFFATWCPPCRDEVPRLLEIDARWRDRGYRLVLVAVSSRHTVERLREFAASTGTGSVLRFDADGSVERAFAVEGLPAHVLLDEAGRVVRRSGSLDRELEAAIHAAMIGHVRQE